MNPTGTGRSQADTQFPSVLGIAAGHKRRRFFVPYLDETDLFLAPAQRFHNPIDAVAGKTKNYFHAPIP
jgi:hypothetical protein